MIMIIDSIVFFLTPSLDNNWKPGASNQLAQPIIEEKILNVKHDT